MKITLDNYKEALSGDIHVPEDKLEAYSFKTRMVNSIENNEVPNDLKEISNIDSISWGHFVTIETYLTLGLDEVQLLKTVVPYLLRPKSEDILDNEDEEKEARHVAYVNSLDIGIVLAIFDRYISLRKQYLFKRYNGVIYKAIDESRNQQDKEENEEPTHSANGVQSAEEMYSKKFFWHNLTMYIANGNLFDYQKALDMKMALVMVHLAEKKMKEIIEDLHFKANRKV